jgi:hypothetical protein
MPLTGQFSKVRNNLGVGLNIFSLFVLCESSYQLTSSSFIAEKHIHDKLICQIYSYTH